MSKTIKITASIVITNNEEKREKVATSVANTLSKNFGKKEITGVNVLDEFVCFNIDSVSCIPLLLSFFPSSLQLYVNGNGVNMAMLK